MEKLKFKLIYIPIMLMLFCGALMIGLTDYITAGFSLAKLSEPAFWTNIICTNGGIACIIISILLINIDKFKENDKDYKSLKESIFNFHKSDDFKPVVFKKYCFEENGKTKKEVYLEKINAKYTKLKPKPKDLDILLSGTPEQKKKNRYCRKVKYYEHLMSSEYVDKNINKFKIKYNTITEDLVFSGVPTNSNSHDYVTKHKAGKALSEICPKYLLTFSITCIMAALSIEFKDGITISVLINTASKLFSICSQIYFAYNYSLKYNQEVTLHDMSFRDSVIKNYSLWLTTKIKQVKNDINEGGN